MAGNSFNDFSMLKALKKELEKKEITPDTSKAQNEPRKRTVKLKSKDEILGEEKGKEFDLHPGMHVTLMDSNDRGIIKHIRKDCVEIELDYGFVVPVGFHDFIVNNAEEDRKLRQSVGSSKIKPATEEKPVITGRAVEIDLHIEALPGGLGVAKGQELPYQMDYFCSILQSRLKHRGSRIIFVHGAGDGILKAAIREELDTVYAISCSWNPYGDGATAVTIK